MTSQLNADYKSLDDLSDASAMNQLKAKLLHNLNPQQREVVCHQDGPLLVLAGAGSGKTMAITHRIAWLIKVCGVHPLRILAITFTNKAAGEMKARVGALIGSVAQNMWIGTFHSMFVRILRRHGSELGYDTAFSIVDTDDALRLIKQILGALNLSEESYKPRAILSVISGAKNQLLTPESWSKQHTLTPFERVTYQVWKDYQAHLKANNSMDFDDILVNIVTLFKNFPEICAQYQERFSYLLVDEYQDTNAPQYEAVRLLAKGHQNICVVGDDDQSIYAFRGADIRNILNFEKDYQRCKTIRLEQNYRSTGHILMAANGVIAKNQSRKAKKLWTSQSVGEKVTHYAAYDQYDEARYIVGEIQRRLRGRSNVDTPLKFSDFAILYRANALSRNFEMILRERGIPYRIFGGLRFYDRKEIKDILAYLRLVINPGDVVSFNRVINVPKRGIGEQTLEKIRLLADEHQCAPLMVCAQAERFGALGRQASKLKQFANLIQALSDQLQDENMSFSDYVAWVQTQTGLVDALLNSSSSEKEQNIDRVENLRELLTDAKEFEGQYLQLSALQMTDMDELYLDDWQAMSTVQQDSPTLKAVLISFLEQAALYTDADEGQQENAVTLMTIHSAKGLEFPVVFLTACDEGIFPSMRSVDSIEGEEEERRLMYVALTRAKEKLYVTSANTRMLYGKTQGYLPSRYLKELPEDCLEHLGKSRQVVGNSRYEGVDSHLVQPRKSEAPGQRWQNTKTLFPAANQSLLYGKPVKKTTGGLVQFKVGDRVSHQRFGAGSVIQVEAIAGDTLILVQFDSGVKKPMMGSQNVLKKQ